MIVTFQEIINEVIRGLGLDSETIETRVLESVKLRINEIQDAIFYDQDWEWRKKLFYLTTTKPYETGTIAVVENSRVVTGTGTVWTDAHKSGYLLVNNRAYKIESFSSGTSMRLAAPYDGDTASGLAYKIMFPEYTLNHEISSIVRIKYNQSDIIARPSLRLTLPANAVGIPNEAAMAGRTSEDYYNTGTVSVTTNSTAVTGVGTAWTTDMEGMSFRVDEFAKFYTIQTVVSPTSITLKEQYEGFTGGGKTYKINARGTQKLTFRYAPDDYYFLELEGLINPIRLVNNNDISLVPNHMPLIHGSIWLALLDLDSKDAVRIQQAKQDYERSLKQLRLSYRVLTTVQWRTETEATAKQQFNPLER